jgi:hypothetical protein
MIARMICGFCAAALLTGTAVAGDASGRGQSKSDPNKVVCRTVSDTGSRLSRSRVCKTNEQWTAMRRDAREAIDHIQNSRAASGN